MIDAAKLLDDVAPNLIGAGAGSVQIDQFGSGRIQVDQFGGQQATWRAVLSIFNGPQFAREAACPSEALRLVLIDADREAADKIRRYRQALNDRRGAEIAAAVEKRDHDDQVLAASKDRRALSAMLDTTPVAAESDVADLLG